MSIFERISRVFTETPSAPQAKERSLELLAASETVDWRKEQLAAAAKKYGRPFKCAADDMPREVFVGGRYVVAVDAGSEVPGRGDTASRSGSRPPRRRRTRRNPMNG
jgi:hypothetical protein